MGLYLNPDNRNFTRDLTKDIYIDKSLMINVINSFIDKNNTYICVSRPRRFGKTKHIPVRLKGWLRSEPTDY